jgi:transcriptional regulator with XRE-family HTH domain
MFTSADMARLMRELRKKQRLTQQQVADLVAAREDTESCTRQAISQAESTETGSRLDGLRIKALEELTGRRLAGPFWRFVDDS